MKRLFLTIILLSVQVNLIFAGPGGKIAKEIFDSPFSKFIGVVLCIIILPLIIKTWYKRNKSINQSKKTLNTLSSIKHEIFDEINLKNRVTDIFTRVHKAWSEQNIEDCDQYISNWYRQNQQHVFLDEWKSKGLMNVCTVQEIKSIKPLHVRLTNQPNFEGTRIMYLINAHMEDYLVKVDDSSVIEGKKGFKDVETVWTLLLIDGVWYVDNIEQSDMISTYLKMESSLSESILQKLSAATKS